MSVWKKRKGCLSFWSSGVLTSIMKDVILGKRNSINTTFLNSMRVNVTH